MATETEVLSLRKEVGGARIEALATLADLDWHFDLAPLLGGDSEKRADYWLRPITSTEAAAFMGISENALRQRRLSGKSAPPGWRQLPDGGFRYMDGRMGLLDWMRGAP